MSRIFVLGGGRVGNAIATVLSKKHFVTVLDLDISKKKNTKSLLYLRYDFNRIGSLASVIKTADLVIGAVPGHLGYKVLEQVIMAKKDIVDISFFPENGLKLHALAKKNNVTAAIDCGVAPGMDNILLGHHNAKEKIISFKCMVGGLPKIKNPPFNYKAPFSPSDVVEEYTRMVKLIRNGKINIMPALTETELVQFPQIGTLEAFNSDGLRSLIYTMKHIPDMVEKTLRYEGHRDQMLFLRELGLLNKNIIELGKLKITPLQLTSALLFDKWKYKTNEEDITIMRVEIENEMHKKYIYDLYDVYDPKSKMSSMARTTGITACAVAECILHGKLKNKGIIPPETIGALDNCFEMIMSYQEQFGIKYKLVSI